MEIKKYNTIPSFKGYDARELNGVLVTDKMYADTLKKLSPKTGVDVFLPNIASKSIKKERFELSQSNKLMWTQDYLTVLNHKVKAVLYDGSRDFLKRVLRATSDGMEKDFGFKSIKAFPHLRGGNFFICNNNGKKELLISENKLIYPQELFQKIYDVEKIHTIPKLDYHLDLFIRPLDNGNVLVADYKMTKDGMQKGIEKIKDYIEKNNLTESERANFEKVAENIELMIKKLDITLKFDPYKPQETLPKVITALKEAGYNPIRVPAAYHYLGGVKNKEREQELLNNFNQNMEELKSMAKHYDPIVQAATDKYIELQTVKKDNTKNLGVEIESFYENNFINSIVHKKDDGKIVYITNAPLLDAKLGITPAIEQKTGFSTKNMFVESVAPYIDKENIHFIDQKITERLFKYQGGIHCTAAEIPSV